MSNEYVPDNYDFFKINEEQEERELSKLPECSECGHAINDEECYLINEELVCSDCVDSWRVKVEDYKK